MAIIRGTNFLVFNIFLHFILSTGEPIRLPDTTLSSAGRGHVLDFYRDRWADVW